MIHHKLDFENANLALDRLMGVGNTFLEPAAATATLSDDSASEPPQTQAELGGIGRLITQVTTASGALPIQNSTVTIFQTNGTPLAIQTTDISGRTPVIELPAPLAIYSQTPGGFRPYSTYNLKVEKPGFYTQELLNIAIFDRIESIQPVALEPLGEDATEYDRLTE